MELLYTTHHSLAHAHVLAPLLSWAIVLGGLYGGVMLVRDGWRWVRRTIERAQPLPPSAEHTREHFKRSTGTSPSC